jgi:hypothetical protein
VVLGVVLVLLGALLVREKSLCAVSCAVAGCFAEGNLFSRQNRSRQSYSVPLSDTLAGTVVRARTFGQGVAHKSIKTSIQKSPTGSLEDPAIQPHWQNPATIQRAGRQQQLVQASNTQRPATPPPIEAQQQQHSTFTYIHITYTPEPTPLVQSLIHCFIVV